MRVNSGYIGAPAYAVHTSVSGIHFDENMRSRLVSEE